MIRSMTATGLAVMTTACLAACQQGERAEAPDIEAVAAIAETLPPASLLLSDGGRGDWTLQITRDPGFDAFAFVRAGADWCSDEWVSQTPGVSVERIDGIDAILFEPGAPEVARFSFQPCSGEVQAAYTPRIPFSDGADAVFLGAFSLIPLQDRAAVTALAGNMMAFEISGDVLRTENPRIQPYLQRFLAHEATHIYQGKTRYEPPRHAWIGEGAAEAISLQVAMDLELADEAVRLQQYAENYALCDQALEGRTLEDAIARGNEGNYDCGDLLALIADAATGEHSLEDLWKMSRRMGEEGYTAEHHFNAMLDLGAEPDLVARMPRFAGEVVEDPLAELRAMSEAVGIVAEFEDGELVSFVVPATAR